MLLIASTECITDEIARYNWYYRDDTDTTTIICEPYGPEDGEKYIVIGPGAPDGIIQFLDSGRIFYYKHRADKHGLNTARNAWEITAHSAWEIQDITADYMDAIKSFYNVSGRQLDLHVLKDGHITLWDDYNREWND